MADLLILVAHPQIEHSRVAARLMRRAAGLGASVPAGVKADVEADVEPAVERAAEPAVEVRDLYALYPDYWVDVAAEQAALAAARLVVWLHPVHWYGMPPLMKLWLDEVFAFGWAYGPRGQALRGKDLWLVASTGGPEDSYRPGGYNRHFFDAFLPPYEQTAALTGLRWLPPLLLHGAHRVPEAELQAHEDLFAQRLAQYPDWPEIAALQADANCLVPADARRITSP